MDQERFVRRFPRLYHMASFESWPLIERHGLLSTSALLDLFEVEGQKREAIESEWRSASIPITHPVYGTAFVRDQLPLRPDLLARCLLDGFSPRDWYRVLNGHVFFWVDEDHLWTLRGAKAYRDAPQTIVEVDTAALLERHLEDVRLSSINSGSILRGGAPRGSGTFRSIAEHSSPRVVELCVVRAVPDIRELVTRARHHWPDGHSEDLFQR
jgi:uncharacterized protein DUF7002